jgi:hypothetical protein
MELRKNNQEPVSNQESTPGLVGVLSDGTKVFDRYKSHVHTVDESDVSSLLKEALARISPSKEKNIVESVVFPGSIGYSTCVTTEPSDEIIFAQRQGRKGGYTRFVVGKKPRETSSLTVVLKKTDEGYILLTAYIGEKSEPEPWDYNATEKSLPFWKTHALIFGSEEIIPGSERKDTLW